MDHTRKLHDLLVEHDITSETDTHGRIEALEVLEGANTTTLIDKVNGIIMHLNSCLEIKDNIGSVVATLTHEVVAGDEDDDVFYSSEADFAAGTHQIVSHLNFTEANTSLYNGATDYDVIFTIQMKIGEGDWKDVSYRTFTKALSKAAALNSMFGIVLDRVISTDEAFKIRYWMKSSWSSAHTSNSGDFEISSTLNNVYATCVSAPEMII